MHLSVPIRPYWRIVLSTIVIGIPASCISMWMNRYANSFVNLCLGYALSLPIGFGVGCAWHLRTNAPNRASRADLVFIGGLAILIWAAAAFLMIPFFEFQARHFERLRGVAMSSIKWVRLSGDELRAPLTITEPMALEDLAQSFADIEQHSPDKIPLAETTTDWNVVLSCADGEQFDMDCYERASRPGELFGTLVAREENGRIVSLTTFRSRRLADWLNRRR